MKADQARQKSENARKKLIGELETHFGDEQVKSLERIQRDLALAIRRRLERLMAIRRIPDDPLFDPVGLAFAVRAMCLLDPDFRQNPLFREAIETIVECQLDDGCWPDGVEIISRHGTATLQPSVEVAYVLAASVHTRDARHSPTAAEVIAMKIALPALQRHARYLELALLDNARGEGRGWSNDRARNSSNPELWTTALAVRFLHFAALINDAVNRAEVLAKYDSSLVTRTRRPNANDPKSPTELFYKELIQPEDITHPVDEIHARFIMPIEKKMIERRYITRPARDGVSFLLFGPPRSGKTFLVKSLAKALGWPLLSLDPGNFVPRAGESVGAMMSRVFDDLKQLHDVVVLFDECDELLISREKEFADVRMPLITSALLTRLASLKDQRGPIFCFATNYYHRVDTAARGVGRFDAVLMFDRPHESARKRIIAKVWAGVHKEHKSALGDAGIEELPERLVNKLADELGGCAYLEIQSAVVQIGLLLFGDSGILTRVPKTEQAAVLDKQLGNNGSPLHKDITGVISRNTPSREDYYRWCAGDGKKDLEACDGGGFSANAKDALIAAWRGAAQRSGVTGLDWDWPIRTPTTPQLPQNPAGS
ncbi:MAG: ATP-binding protein [Planctomycetota bacterium]